MVTPDKIQLNLCIDLGTNSLFRDLAKRSGFGQRPSPFLNVLLQVYVGSMHAIYKRLVKLAEDNPRLLAGKEQRFYAMEISDLLRKLIKEELERDELERGKQ